MADQINETGAEITTPELDLKLNPEDAAKIVEKSAKPPKKKKDDADDSSKELTIGKSDFDNDDKFQEVLADPDFVAYAKKVVLADTERNKPAPPSDEEMAAASYNRLVAKFGKDFVHAQKGQNQTYFSRVTWNNMRNKLGWIEVIKTMPEVENKNN